MGTLIAIEGIDGSGKSLILDICGQWLEKRGKSILDLRNHFQNNEYPTLATLISTDTLLCEEPTKSPLGKRVREMMRFNTPAEIIAQAFDMDRSELFIRAICPMLDEGKIVIEERSLLSSLVYQGVQGMRWESITHLPGNQIALQFPPKVVILADVPAKTAMKRLSTREKQDHAIYERETFLRIARKTYLSARFRQFVHSQGAELIVLDTSRTKAGIRIKTLRILDRFLKT